MVAEDTVSTILFQFGYPSHIICWKIGGQEGGREGMSRAFWALESVLLPVQPVLKEKLKQGKRVVSASFMSFPLSCFCCTEVSLTLDHQCRL